MSNTTWPVMRTTLRGARAGLAGLAFISLLLLTGAGLTVHAAWHSGRTPGLAMALVMPWFGAFCGALAMGLLVSLWVQMQRPAAARLAPGAGAAMVCALRLSAAGLWVWTALPAVAVVAVAALDAANALPLGAGIVYALGVPAAGAASAAALIALPARPWVRRVAFALVLLPMLAPSGWPNLVSLPAAPRNALLLAAGLAGLLWAAWVLQRVARLLTQVHEAAGDAQLLPLWRIDGTSREPTGRTPADGRWLVTPHPGGLRAAEWLLIAVVALLVAVMLPRLGAVAPAFAANLVFIIAGTSSPWLAGAWVSPRWSLLPGSPARRHTAWRLLAQSLSGGAPRTLALTLIYATVAQLAAPISLDRWLAILLACGAIVVLSASLAVAALAWFRTPWLQAGAPMAGVILGIGLFTAALHHEAVPWALAAWPDLSHAATLALACAALSLLVVAASGRAWARYDWARMRAQPAIHGKLFRKR